MKRIILAIAAITAIAACTKSEVTYEAPGEIGFNVVAGNITKAPVTGEELPDELNLYVNAYVQDAEIPTAPDYINNGEFVKRTDRVDGKKVWGGKDVSYYWPNEQKLHFSGFSKSGTYDSASYVPSTGVLTITNYAPGNGTALGSNDLMWFPSTSHSKPAGYGKEDGSFPAYVPVNMYHTCSWITFRIQGDATTGKTGSSYAITSLKINVIDLVADVTCTGDGTDLANQVEWSDNQDQTGEYQVTVNGGSVSLAETYESDTIKNPKNVETGETGTSGGNVVVIPQIPGTINITWTYTSPAHQTVNDSATGLSLKLNDDNSLEWEPGKHYIYTITLKANEILIAPTPVDWTDPLDKNITVE